MSRGVIDVVAIRPLKAHRERMHGLDLNVAMGVLPWAFGLLARALESLWSCTVEVVHKTVQDQVGRQRDELECFHDVVVHICKLGLVLDDTSCYLVNGNMKCLQITVLRRVL